MPPTAKMILSDLKAGEGCRVVAVKDTSVVFLQYLKRLGISIGTKITVIEKVSFDGSVQVSIDDQEARNVSVKFADSLFVAK
jgi:DtxR family Mn-dependent transcriptional regulator